MSCLALNFRRIQFLFFAYYVKSTVCLHFPVVEETVEVTRVQEREANPMAMSSNSRRLQNRNPVLRSLSSSCASNPNPIQNPVVLMHSSMDSVFAKMSSATQSLMETDDIETSTQLVKLIKECADCVLSLKNASLVHQ